MKTIFVILTCISFVTGCSNGVGSLRAKAEKGDAESQFQLGRLYVKGKEVPQDYVEAMKWYRKAANQGHAAAEFAIGSLYWLGHGVTQDYTEAARWTSKAADAGLPEAEVALGTSYDQGLGVEQDPAKAFAWISIALEMTTDDKLKAKAKMYLASVAQAMTQEQRNQGAALLNIKEKQFHLSDSSEHGGRE